MAAKRTKAKQSAGELSPAQPPASLADAVFNPQFVRIGDAPAQYNLPIENILQAVLYHQLPTYLFAEGLHAIPIPAPGPQLRILRPGVIAGNEWEVWDDENERPALLYRGRIFGLKGHVRISNTADDRWDAGLAALVRSPLKPERPGWIVNDHQMKEITGSEVMMIVDEFEPVVFADLFLDTSDIVRKAVNSMAEAAKERHASKREEVLRAAIAVWASEPGRAVKTSSGKVNGAELVKMIEQNAGLFWPETGSPPLAHETIEVLINSAIRAGKNPGNRKEKKGK